ncbi:MAG: hypothetical protein VCA36_09550 [Opitutales bacterium]
MKKIVILLLLGLLAWGGYQWRESKERDRRIKEVEKRLEQGHREEASAALEELLAGQANDPETLRLVARMAASENPRKALEILHLLRTRNKTTWRDLVLLVEISQDHPEESPELSILAELEKNHGKEPEVHVLRARQDFLEGRIGVSLQRLNKVLTKFPRDRSARLQRARIQLLAPDLAARIEAKLVLFDLGKANDRVGHIALRVLVNREVGPTFFPEDALEASAALQRHPLTGDSTFLRASSLRLRLEPDRREDILAAAVERVGKRDKVLLSVWLNGELAPSMVLETLSSADAVADEEKFFPRFQAFLLLKRIAEARKLRATAVLGEAAEARADAYLELAQGKSDGAFEVFVRRAAASGDQQALVEAGRLALLGGRWEESWSGYLQALDAGGEGIVQPVGLQLLQLALHRRETEVAWRTAKLLAERAPRRAGNRNNYAYLSLLLNREVAAATLAAEEAVKVGPRNTAFLSTLALARFREGHLDEAREIMERRGELGLTPGEKATKAAIFLALDRKVDAAETARGLRAEMMLPEEWELLGELAGKE